MNSLRIRAIMSLLTIIAVMFIGMIAARPARAASSTGAQKFNLPYCLPEYNGYTFCGNEEGVLNTTRTPSGNMSYTISGTSAYTLTDSSGIVVDQASYRYSHHQLTVDGMLQVLNYHGHGTFTYEGMTCIYRSVYTYANGELRVYLDTDISLCS